MLIFPEKEASNISIDDENLKLTLKDGKLKIYALKDIVRIILSEKFDGIYINSNNETKTYKLPIDYKNIEKMIDSVNGLGIFLKEAQLIETNEKMDSNKDLNNVKTTYKTRFKRYTITRNIDASNGSKTIYYTNNFSR